MSCELSIFADSALLRQRVADCFGHASPRVEVAVRVGVDLAATSPQAGQPWLRTGCVTKLLTAALVLDACAAGELALDDGAAQRLGPGSRRSVLDGVTLRHLLEHTHGLDGSLLDTTPVRSDGFIDVERLRAAIELAGPLTRPGRLYSYGDLGARVAAAVLERRTGERYATLLEQRLLAPLGIEACCLRGPGRSMPRPCPATGGPLAVPLVQLLELLGHVALERYGPCFEHAAHVAGRITRPPGFSVLERGIFLGFKHYGEGWFGHHSTWPGAQVLVRVHPGRRAALVVASSEPPPVVAAARLFGDWLPELRSLRIPQPLGAEAARRCDPARYTGVYRTAAEKLTIAESPDGRLGLRAALRARGSGTATQELDAGLRPARGGLWLAVPTLADIAYVQRIESADGTYLWNGRRLWRAVSG